MVNQDYEFILSYCKSLNCLTIVKSFDDESRDRIVDLGERETNSLLLSMTQATIESKFDLAEPKRTWGEFLQE